MGTYADKGLSAPPERQQRHGSFSWVGVRPGQHILDLAFRRRQAKSGNQQSPAPRPPIVGPTVAFSSTFLSRATDFLLHPHNSSDGHETHTWFDIKLNSISTSNSPHGIALDASTTTIYPTTQVELSTKQLAWERARVRGGLAESDCRTQGCNWKSTGSAKGSRKDKRTSSTFSE